MQCAQHYRDQWRTMHTVLNSSSICKYNIAYRLMRVCIRGRLFLIQQFTAGWLAD